MKSLIKKLGITGINIVPNISVRSVFPNYGFKHNIIRALSIESRK
jgi:hypothetical protein